MSTPLAEETKSENKNKSETEQNNIINESEKNNENIPPEDISKKNSNQNEIIQNQPQNTNDNNNQSFPPDFSFKADNCSNTAEINQSEKTYDKLPNKHQIYFSSTKKARKKSNYSKGSKSIKVNASELGQLNSFTHDFNNSNQNLSDGYFYNQNFNGDYFNQTSNMVNGYQFINQYPESYGIPIDNNMDMNMQAYLYQQQIHQEQMQQEQIQKEEEKKLIKEMKEDKMKQQKKEDEKIFKDCYLDFLVKTVNGLLTNGEITMDYLNTPTPKKIQQSAYLTRKCKNKLCPNFVNAKSQSKYCNSCSEELQKGNYCYYCKTIYKDKNVANVYNNEKGWIQCDYCNKWHHIYCEEKKGDYKNFSKIINSKTFKYMCPFCKCTKQKNHSPTSKRNSDNKYDNSGFKNKLENRDIYQDYKKMLEIDEEDVGLKEVGIEIGRAHV